METQHLITVSQAARELGREGNTRLIRTLLRFHQIPTTRIGPCRLIDRNGFKALKRAVGEWDNRPRVTQKGA